MKQPYTFAAADKGRLAALALAAACALGALAACTPLVVGGAFVGGALMASDRRTSGAQIEDQTIELRGTNRLRDALGERGHINVTSYNRQVLLTGEVPSAQDKALAEQTIAGVENVRSIVNELALMGNSSLTQRSSDVLQTGKVKAALLDAKDLFANAFKVVTERGTTYLMGRVTASEAGRATEVVRGVSGVSKVVRVFEIITEAELQQIAGQPSPSTLAQSPGQAATTPPPVAPPSPAPVVPSATPVQVTPVQAMPVPAPAVQGRPLPSSAASR